MEWQNMVWPQNTISESGYVDFLFATAKVASITVIIFFHIILHPAVLIYNLSIFITSSSSFHGVYNEPIQHCSQLACVAQLVERCTGITEVKGSNPVQAWKKIGAFFSQLQKLRL